MKVGVRRALLLSHVIIVAIFTNTPAIGQTDSNDPFVRIKQGDQGNLVALQTSVPQYAGKEITVDLVSAVHVASRSYYQALNERFKKYDTVLYELIIPEGFSFDATTPAQVEKRDIASPIPVLQKMLTQALGLSFQLEEINYRAPNFVHADFTTKEFAESMKMRGETFFSIIMRVIAAGLQTDEATRDPAAEFNLLVTLLQNPSKERELRLRRLLAKEILRSKSLIDSINGTEGSTIITARNDKALAVLREEIKRGKRHFAIFYGGGHMGDIATKLENDFALERVSTEWLDAWDLRPEALPVMNGKSD